MAHRPDPAQFDKPLSRSDVDALYQHLSTVDPFRVQRAYQQAFEKCRLYGDILPKASAIQELVIAWKVLRARRKQRAPRRD